MRRVLRPEDELDLSCTLRPLRRGPGDPTIRINRGEVWRATRTPDGPATAHFRREGSDVVVAAWGSGSDWILDRAAQLVGLEDEPSSFLPRHPLLCDLHRRHPGMRFGASGAVVEALVCSVLEQKVRGVDAWCSYRRLVHRFSEPAPGPAALMLPPDPKIIVRLGYYDFHPLGVERRRAEAILRVCSVASTLNRAAAMASAAAQELMVKIPGIGAWTAAEVARVALGDVDAVSVGDLHLPHLVSWTLAGEPRGDDARMLELLEPYRGQRARAVRLLEISGMTAPRRGPRYSPIPIARL